MAAHEEKISSKRRKLFKALSAAPVVMTLRPGDAVANNSAFQCAEKILDPGADPNLAALGPTPPPTTDFVFETYDYFMLNDVPDTCSLSDLTDDFVVYIDSILYGNNNPGIAITTGFTYEAGSAVAPPKLTLLKPDGTDCTVIEGSAGNFALLDNVVEDGQFQGVAFPKADPLGPNMQGITGTCMASINGLPTSQSLIG